MYRLETGIRQQQSVGICQPDVFGGEYYQAAGNKLDIFASGYHTSQPIDRGIGVAPAYAFDESRYDVVMHLAVFVVSQRVLLQTVFDEFVVYHYCPFGLGVDDKFEDIE